METKTPPDGGDKHPRFRKPLGKLTGPEVAALFAMAGMEGDLDTRALVVALLASQYVIWGHQGYGDHEAASLAVRRALLLVGCARGMTMDVSGSGT